MKTIHQEWLRIYNGPQLASWKILAEDEPKLKGIMKALFYAGASAFAAILDDALAKGQEGEVQARLYADLVAFWEDKKQ